MKVKVKIVIAVMLVMLVGFVGFELWGLTGRAKVPCSSICNIEVEVLVLPSEKQEFIDPETVPRLFGLPVTLHLIVLIIMNRVTEVPMTKN